MQYADKLMPLLSFDYGGMPFKNLINSAETVCTCREEKDFKVYELTYLLEDVLEVTQRVREFNDFNACEWVTYFKNVSKSDSKIISELNDCDVSFPFEYDETPKSAGFLPAPETAKIYNMSGSTWAKDEFVSSSSFIEVGKKRNYSPTGGRSSQTTAPFFDVNRKEKGVICTIGWTGQWRAEFARDETAVNIKTGIENVRFKLHPDEEIRTSSMLVLSYNDGQTNGHNAFRRLIKKHFSLIGKEGRADEAPLCSMFWGGLDSKTLTQRINKMSENKLGYEYVWIDAGWYGNSTLECANEFEGDWDRHTGSWNVNRMYHPNEFRDVSEAIEKAGMKFLLWVEPERVFNTTATPAEHPDWFLKSSLFEDNMLLNLGNDEALRGTIDMVSELVEKLNLGCYRQDFNIDPLTFWRENDEKDREGIHEIKHIMGLYKFWDALLKRFPSLLIDNCSSGGKRIDIETLRRSVPLWRSDYQCAWNIDPEAAQIHNGGISWWIPYSGTGTGRVMNDDYRARSCYCAALANFYWGYADCAFPDEASLNWVRKINAEYKIIRPYMSCDYYRLIEPSLSDSDWAAMQYDRPEEGDGVILLFRREKSPFAEATLQLGGLSCKTAYNFMDIDTGETTEVFSDDLIKNGFKIALSEKRSSKVVLYTKGDRV